MGCRTTALAVALLATLCPLRAQVEEVILHEFNVEAEVGEWDYVTHKVSIGGKLYHGYGRPIAAVLFNVAGFDLFRAYVGAKDGSTGSCEVSIEVDNKRVWHERVRAGQPARQVSIVLTGHRQLTLRSGLQGVFAEPRLVHGLAAAQPAAEGAPGAAGTEWRADAPIAPTTGLLAGRTVYHNSFALLVGVCEYARLSQDKWLRYPVNDVNAVREVLIASYGFAPENVTVLTNQAASLEGIRQALARLADRRVVQPEDRVLIYFSGHGQTVKLANGGEMGFLIPSDADLDAANPDNAGPFLATCLSMKSLWDYLESTPAKHSLVLVDACYSGLLGQVGSAAPERLSTSGLAAVATRRAMQVMTAGRQGDLAYENAAFAHGAFTYKLLEALQAGAATPGTVFTASQLHTTVKRSVSLLAGIRQTPQLASYNTEGEFLFIAVPPLAPLPRPAPSPRRPSTTTPGQAPGPTAKPNAPQRGPNGHWYQAVDMDDGVTWRVANLAASRLTYQGLTGHLATITSFEESEYVTATFPDAVHDGYWLGGRQDRTAPDYREPDGGWRWVTGEAWAYTKWSRNPVKEPNNANDNEDYLCFSPNGCWNDQSAALKLPGFMVEYEPAAGQPATAPQTAPAPPAERGQPATTEARPDAPQRGPQGHWYQAVAVDDGLVWRLAQVAASKLTHEGLAGHLATLTTQAEADYVTATFPDAVRDCYWLGGYQDRTAPDYQEPAKGWRWVTGEPWSFTNWNRGLYQEPNNADGVEDYLSFSSNGRWNDQSATVKLPGYIVEFEPAAR